MSTCLKRALARALASSAVALCAATTANAAVITADLTRVGGNTWDASFTVEADPGQTVEAFSIYFDWTQVSNLAVGASPVDWDSIAIPADAALTSDGYFDALALGSGIGGASSLGGFAARLDWAQPSGPSAMYFTINDPLTFAPTESGIVVVTSGNGTGNPVSEPATWTVGLLGLALLLARQTMPRAGAVSAVRTQRTSA